MKKSFVILTVMLAFASLSHALGLSLLSAILSDSQGHLRSGFGRDVVAVRPDAALVLGGAAPSDAFLALKNEIETRYVHREVSTEELVEFVLTYDE